MQVISEFAEAASVAAGTANTGAADCGGRSLQAHVFESAVQLASNLVEQLLARDQIVCGLAKTLARHLRPCYAPKLVTSISHEFIHRTFSLKYYSISYVLNFYLFISYKIKHLIV